MEKRTRNNVVYLRLSDDEYRILLEKCKLSKHRNVSDYLRQQIVEDIVYYIDYKYLRKYNYQLGKIGTNINQIAKKANETGYIYVSEIKVLQRQQEELINLMKLIMQRLSQV